MPVSTTQFDRVSVEACRTMLAAGKRLNIIDVRTPAEFARVHVDGATLMPLDRLDAKAIAAVRSNDNEPIYVTCHSGARAGKACEQLVLAGLQNICCIDGGTAAWEKAGLPVQRPGGKVISLERQTRIAIGSLVLVGLILAWTVHPAFSALAAFMGGGLVFAGLTDTCALGMLLGKMPWNQGNLYK